jgi:hypothetical protein
MVQIIILSDLMHRYAYYKQKETHAKEEMWERIEAHYK